MSKWESFEAMKKINYLDILKNSWNLTWINKHLWWFGLFLALGSSGLSFNYPMRMDQSSANGDQLFKIAGQFVANHWNLIIAGTIIFAVIVLAVIILKVISRGGLIKSISEITTGKNVSFKNGFTVGRKYFWRVFTVGLVISLFFAGIAIALFTPVMFLLYLKSYFGAILIAIPAVLIAAVLGIFSYFIRQYAYIYLVVSNLGIGASLENALLVFNKNILVSIIFSLFLIAIGMVIGIVTAVSIVATGLVFFIVGLILNLLFAKIGIIITVITGSLVALLLMLAVQSIFEVFKQTAWLLFFREIAVIKKEETVTEAESIKAPEKVLDAEGA
jgi:hypothetical protein